jgi:hypothetical protein
MQAPAAYYGAIERRFIAILLHRPVKSAKRISISSNILAGATPTRHRLLCCAQRRATDTERHGCANATAAQANERVVVAGCRGISHRHTDAGAAAFWGTPTAQRAQRAAVESIYPYSTSWNAWPPAPGAARERDAWSQIFWGYFGLKGRFCQPRPAAWVLKHTRNSPCKGGSMCHVRTKGPYRASSGSRSIPQAFGPG